MPRCHMSTQITVPRVALNGHRFVAELACPAVTGRGVSGQNLRGKCFPVQFTALHSRVISHFENRWGPQLGDGDAVGFLFPLVERAMQE